MVSTMHLPNFTYPTSSLFFSLGGGAVRAGLTKRNPLVESWPSIARACGETRIAFVREQPSAEIVRVDRANVW